MRRLHLRGRENILKRYLVHVAGFNLSLVMRQIFGVGTPRGLQGRCAALVAALVAELCDHSRSWRWAVIELCHAFCRFTQIDSVAPPARLAAEGPSSTGC